MAVKTEVAEMEKVKLWLARIAILFGSSVFIYFGVKGLVTGDILWPRGGHSFHMTGGPSVLLSIAYLTLPIAGATSVIRPYSDKTYAKLTYSLTGICVAMIVIARVWYGFI